MELGLQSLSLGEGPQTVPAKKRGKGADLGAAPRWQQSLVKELVKGKVLHIATLATGLMSLVSFLNTSFLLAALVMGMYPLCPAGLSLAAFSQMSPGTSVYHWSSPPFPTTDLHLHSPYGRYISEVQGREL